MENEDLSSCISDLDESAVEMIRSLRDLHAVADSVICPLLNGMINKTPWEGAMVGTFLRMKQLIFGLCVLDDPCHFQITNAVTRTVFELCLDLHALSKDPSLESKFWSFAQVSRFRKAQQLVAFLDNSPVVDRASHADAIQYVSDSTRSQRIETVVRTHWGSDSKGRPSWPEHWSGLDIATRANRAGVKYEEFYRSRFSHLSHHVHAGMGGIQGLSESALTCGFAIALYSAHTLFENSLNIMIDAFRLKEADASVKDRMTGAILSSRRESAANDLAQPTVLLTWSDNE